MNWQPTASLAMLRERATLIAAIRDFFSEREVLEVEVPALGATTVSDTNLESLHVYRRESLMGYLQTSPEYYMKRLLAAGSGAIFSLAKAYRSDELGRYHNPEFTMLEWYRPGFDDRVLADEVVQLCKRLEPQVQAQYVSYGDVFREHCGLNPHLATDSQLAAHARKKLNVAWQNEPRSLWLDLLFSHLVEPQLNGLVVVYDYPECQCALARLGHDAFGHVVSRRFEVYWRGVELANGYWELCDAAEQRQRFEQDNRARTAQGKVAIEPDRALIAALESGLPDCAGVALGVDRLMMCVTGKTQIRDVISFAGD